MDAVGSASSIGGQSGGSAALPDDTNEAGNLTSAGASAVAGAGGALEVDELPAAGGGGEGGVAGAASSLCDRYCAATLASCTGTFAVYTSLSACLAVCARLPPGEPGARTGNSVECRLRAAEMAAEEVPHYCPIAGPGGNGVCGSNCESLCWLRDNICASYVEGDPAHCLTACALLEDNGSYSTDLSEGQYEGAHVQCRLYHVSAAALDDPEPHCAHVDGALPCQ